MYEIPENNAQVFVENNQTLNNDDQVFHETFDNTLNDTNEITMGQSAAQIVPDGDQIQTGNYQKGVKNLYS